MSTERDKKEDKTMANTNDARRAHDVLDGLSAGRILSKENEQLLRSFLPEPPAQMTLEALRHDVHDVWAGVHGNEWPDDMYCDLEAWLSELYIQMKGLRDTPATVPALPAGMRMAKHEEYGRCVVSPGRNHFGQCMIFVLDSDREEGSDWHYEPSTSLTFLDTSPTARAHPEFLETEADYQKAPEGTIVARDGINSWIKEDGAWVQGVAVDETVYTVPCLKGVRRVLRWGWGK